MGPEDMLERAMSSLNLAANVSDEHACHVSVITARAWVVQAMEFMEAEADEEAESGPGVSVARPDVDEGEAVEREGDEVQSVEVEVEAHVVPVCDAADQIKTWGTPFGKISFSRFMNGVVEDSDPWQRDVGYVYATLNRGRRRKGVEVAEPGEGRRLAPESPCPPLGTSAPGEQAADEPAKAPLRSALKIGKRHAAAEAAEAALAVARSDWEKVRPGAGAFFWGTRADHEYGLRVEEQMRIRFQQAIYEDRRARERLFKAVHP